MEKFFSTVVTIAATLIAIRVIDALAVTVTDTAIRFVNEYNSDKAA